MAGEKSGKKVVATNRKAFHEYYIEKRFEAGIELYGTEVKSIRLGNVNMKDAYCVVKNGELFLRGMHISPYEKGNIFNREPERTRRLLMHRREINTLGAAAALSGSALIPLSLYLSKSYVKVEIALCKGKKLHDKRDAAREKDAAREISRSLKEYRK